MSEIVLSIIVPVYNTEEYIEECIRSITQNSEPYVEILLIDDGSTDRSPAICKEYVQKDCRIHYFRQENKGVSAARNHGLALAKGRWILFVDADDTINGDTVQNVLKVERSDADVTVFKCPFLKERKKKIRVQAKTAEELCLAAIGMEDYSTKWFGAVFSCVWGKLYSREFLQRNNIRFPEEIVMGEDLLFNCTVYSRISNVLFVPDDFYHYRINQTSASRGRNPKVAERDYIFLNKLKDFATANAYSKLGSDGCKYAAINGIIISYNAFFSRFRMCEYAKMRRELTEFLGRQVYSDALVSYPKYRSKFNLKSRVLLFCLKNRLFLCAFLMKKVLLCIKN